MADAALLARPDPVVAFFTKRRIHYGWVIAAVTFLTSLVTAGAYLD